MSIRQPGKRYAFDRDPDEFIEIPYEDLTSKDRESDETVETPEEGDDTDTDADTLYLRVHNVKRTEFKGHTIVLRHTGKFPQVRRRYGVRDPKDECILLDQFPTEAEAHAVIEDMLAGRVDLDDIRAREHGA